MSLIISILLTGILAIAIYNLSLFLRCRAQAKASGFPYFCFPIADTKHWYMIANLDPVIWIIDNLFPLRLRDYINSSSYTRRWHVSYRLHEKLGDVLLQVSAAPLSVYIADADAAKEVFSGWGNYVKPGWNMDHLRLFGDNVVACEDVDAAYHRKHVQPPFNERNSALVWQQSLKQAEDMLSLWVTSPVVEKSRVDFRRLALHILSSAAFGVNLSFLPKVGVEKNSIFIDGEPKEGYTRSWRHTLEYMAGNLVEIIAAKSMLPEWAMPDMMSVLRDMRCYIDTLIDGADMKAGVNGNLLSAIASTGKGDMKYEHIMGNVFILSVAGQETMSNTMQYAFIMLALNLEAQEWFARRLEEQLKDLPENWTYEEAYNRLSAPRCLMYETLRLFPPLPSIVKWTATPQTLLGHLIPGNSNISVNLGGLHHNPKYWGDNAAAWDPSRWDFQNKDSFLGWLEQPMEWAEAPGLWRPRQGSYYPFSGGGRACLGRKFAMVEFVAVFAKIMKGKRVRLAEGESMDGAWKKIRRSKALTSLVANEDIIIVLEDR